MLLIINNMNHYVFVVPKSCNVNGVEQFRVFQRGE